MHKQIRTQNCFVSLDSVQEAIVEEVSKKKTKKKTK